MEKPDLKKEALSIGEAAVIEALEKIAKPYAKFLIEQSENKYDDLLLPFVDELIEAVKSQVDKLDGEVDIAE